MILRCTISTILNAFYSSRPRTGLSTRYWTQKYILSHISGTEGGWGGLQEHGLSTRYWTQKYILSHISGTEGGWGLLMTAIWYN